MKCSGMHVECTTISKNNLINIPLYYNVLKYIFYSILYVGIV